MISIAAYGAIGDGDQSKYLVNQNAIQTALNNHEEVYIPVGDFVTLDVSFAHANTRLVGEGDKSILTYVTGAGTSLLTTGNRPVTIEGIKLRGGYYDDKRFLTAPLNGCTGLTIAPQFNSRVRHITVEGFGGIGVKTEAPSYDPSTDINNRLHFSDSLIQNNYWGLYIPPNGAAEYQMFSGLRLTKNCIAYSDRAGNINASHLDIMDNGTGAELIGYTYSNNSHSNLSNSLINHSVLHSIHINGCSVGYNLIGNQIHLGNIFIEDSTGVQIACGTIHVGEIRMKGGGRGMIHHNFMLSSPENGLINTVIHNAGANDKMLLRDNWTPTAAFPDSQGADA